jgi:hypothetical protein
MKVTRELASKVREAIDRSSGMLVDLEDVTAALVKALADVPEVSTITYDPKSPPSAEFPFRLTEEERQAREYLGDGFPCDVRLYTRILVAALDRALATLAAPKVELSKTEEGTVGLLERAYRHEQTSDMCAALNIIRRHFPDPMPPEKTPGQVFFETMHPKARWSGCMNKDEVERAVRAAVEHAKGKP